MPEDARVIHAQGVTKGDAFGQWEAELNKAGFAVIHDKIVVIDPFSDNCVVVTGSHNLGYKASYDNDENMAIIRDHPRHRGGLRRTLPGRLRPLRVALLARPGGRQGLAFPRRG